MSSMEAKREQFRKYLERCGLLDALCKSLIKLYEEPNKPDDAIRFVRKYMCEACPDDEQFNAMKHNLSQANRKIAAIEEELERFKGNLKLTPSQVALNLENGFKLLQEDDQCGDSLLRKFLLRETFNQLATVQTKSNGATLLDVVQSGFAHHDSVIGVYAPDAESYDTFKILFEPIIVFYHQQEDNNSASLQPPIEWGNPDDIKNLDPDGKFIESTRILAARNLDGYAHFQLLTEEEFVDIEDRIRTVAENLDGDLKGNFYCLRDIDVDEQQEMIQRQVLYAKGNKFLADAACYRFWPSGRAVFMTPEEDFLLWVNEEDHLRVIAKSQSGDLNDVYLRFMNGMKNLADNLKFLKHPRYGFVTTCPSFLGTGVRPTVRIRLPNLTRECSKLEDLADRFSLQVRGTGGGEQNEIVDGVMDVSYRKRLGITEFDVVKNFQDGILELIKVEEELEL